MTIGQAYLYADRITAGEEPPMPDDVYFENGRFNPLYVESGFDFTDSDIKHESTYYYAKQAAEADMTYITAHKVIQAMAPNSGEWVIDNGELVRIMTAPFTSSDDNGSCVFLPITMSTSQLIAYTTKLNVNIAIVDESGWYGHVYLEVYVFDTQRNRLNRVVSDKQISPSGSSSYVVYSAEFWNRTDPTYPPPYYIVFYASELKEVRIKKIWFTDLNT